MSRRSGGRKSRVALRSAPLAEAMKPVHPGESGGQFKPLREEDVAAVVENSLRILEEIGFNQATPHCIETCTAFGAVMGSVIQRAQITVTQPQHGIFCLFHGDQPRQYENLDKARAEAEQLVAEMARDKALQAGAIDPTVNVHFDDIHVKDEVDGELFLESTVIATAIGPACDWR